MVKIMKNSWIYFLVIYMFSSCGNNRIIKQKVKDINSVFWHKDSIVKINFKPKSNKNYDLSFLIRNDINYPYSNIFLIAKIEGKNKKIIDTLEYEMADEKGNWLGSGFGEIKESKLLYKKNYRFKDTINYEISVRQATRKTGNLQGDTVLNGIKTVGIIIEKSIK